MIFCRSKCRNDYKNRRTKYDNQVKEKEDKLAYLKKGLVQAEQDLQQCLDQKAKRDKEIAAEEVEEEKFRKFHKELELLTDEELYQLISEEELKKETDPDQRDYLNDQLRFCEESIKQEIVDDYRKEKAHLLEQLITHTIKRFCSEFLTENSTLKPYKSKISELENQIVTLEKTEIKLELPDPPTKPTEQLPVVKFSKKGKQARIEALDKSKNTRQMDGSQIRNTDFNTYTLPGQLGEFFGNLDDNMIAIALTGNASAGKSYFSYQLAKLFMDSGKTARYYSLEEGIGNLTKEKLDLYDIGEEMVVVDYASLDEIDKAAKEFDVIIIDSYSKISKDPEDYEILRQTHPKTIFIVIFQKTTSNTIRGGSSITFNSSIIIDVRVEKRKYGKERIATMKKSRYGTSLWEYSITNGFITVRS